MPGGGARRRRTGRAGGPRAPGAAPDPPRARRGGKCRGRRARRQASLPADPVTTTTQVIQQFRANLRFVPSTLEFETGSLPAHIAEATPTEEMVRAADALRVESREAMLQGVFALAQPGRPVQGSMNSHVAYESIRDNLIGRLTTSLPPPVDRSGTQSRSTSQNRTGVPRNGDDRSALIGALDLDGNPRARALASNILSQTR